MNKDLSRLSMSEELWLWRLRQPTTPRRTRTSGGKFRRGLSHAQAAKFLGMTVERYKNLEAGRRINVAADELPSLAFLRMERPEISPREQVILARRRSGLLIRQIAKEYGLSHTRLLAHEDAVTRRLVDFWTNKGFYGWNLPPQVPRPLLIRRAIRIPEPPLPSPAPPPVVTPPRPVLLRRSA